MTIFRSIWIIFLFLILVGQSDGETYKLGLMFPTEYDSVKQGAQEMEFGARLAASLINDREISWFSDIEWSLEIHSLPTNGAKDDPIEKVLEFSDIGVVAVVGERSSGATEYGAYVANAEKIPIIPPLASSPMFSDKVAFKFFSRTSPSDELQGKAICALANSLGWTKLGIIHIDDVYGRLLADKVVESSPEFDVSVEFDRSFSSYDPDYEVIISDLMAEELSIVVLCAEADRVREILLEASRQGVGPKDIMWIGVDAWTSSAVFNANTTEESDTIINLLEGTVGLNFYLEENGVTYKMLDELWRASDKEDDLDLIDPSEGFGAEGALTMDAVFLVAHAIENAIQAGADPNDGSIFLEYIRSAEFNGSSGFVSLDHETGERIGNYRIYYASGGAYTAAGIAYSDGTIEHELSWEAWPEGKAPVSLPCDEGQYYDSQVVECLTGYSIPERIYLAVMMPLFKNDTLVMQYAEAYEAVLSALNTTKTDFPALDRTDLRPIVFQTDGNVTRCAQVSDDIINFEKDGFKISGIIAGALSECIEEMYIALAGQKIPTVAFGAASADLSEPKYTYFFRTIPSDLYQAESLSAFAVKMNWTRVAVLYRTNNSHSENWSLAFERTALVLTDGKSIVKAEKYFQTNDELKSALQDLKDAGFRIFYVAEFFQNIPRFMFEANELDMVGNGYTYMLGTNGTARMFKSEEYGGFWNNPLLSGAFTSTPDYHTAATNKSLIDEDMRGACQGECDSCRNDHRDDRGTYLWKDTRNGKTLCIASAAADSEDEGADYTAPLTFLAVDAVYAMIQGLSSTLARKSGVLSGAILKEELLGIEFEGVTGHVNFHDVTGDRMEGRYSIINLSPRTSQLNYSEPDDPVVAVWTKHNGTDRGSVEIIGEMTFTTKDGSIPLDGCVSENEKLDQDTHECVKCEPGRITHFHNDSSCVVKEVDLTFVDIGPSVICGVAIIVLLRIYLWKRTPYVQYVGSVLASETAIASVSAFAIVVDYGTDVAAFAVTLQVEELSSLWPMYFLAILLSTVVFCHSVWTRLLIMREIIGIPEEFRKHDLLGYDMWKDKLQRVRVVARGAVASAFFEDVPMFVLNFLAFDGFIGDHGSTGYKVVIVVSLAINIAMFGYRVSLLDRMLLVGPMEDLVQLLWDNFLDTDAQTEANKDKFVDDDAMLDDPYSAYRRKTSLGARDSLGVHVTPIDEDDEEGGDHLSPMPRISEADSVDDGSLPGLPSGPAPERKRKRESSLSTDMSTRTSRSSLSIAPPRRSVAGGHRPSLVAGDRPRRDKRKTDLSQIKVPNALTLF